MVEKKKTPKTKKIAKPKADKHVSDARDAKPESFPEDGDLPGMETPAIPSLERKGREIANRRDRIKRLQEEEKGLVAEALVIMHDHEIKVYSKHDVVLRIDEKELLKVEVG